MGADYVLHRSCQVKQALGNGDVAGTVEMLRLIKVGHMARLLEEKARKEGKSPDELSLVRQERNATTGEMVERPLSYASLREQEAPLTSLAVHCSGCPVNLLSRTFGCYGALRYPITSRSEEWLMQRLELADSPGGFLCLKAVADLGYTGEPIQRWRESDSVQIFERRQPVERILDPARPEEKVNSNQIWHPLLALKNELQPIHCLYVPMWVGGVRLDGEVPSRPEHLTQITQLTTFEERKNRTKFDLGPTNQGPDVFAVQRLLFACYSAWLHDVTMLMDS